MAAGSSAAVWPAHHTTTAFPPGSSSSSSRTRRHARPSLPHHPSRPRRGGASLLATSLATVAPATAVRTASEEAVYEVVLRQARGAGGGSGRRRRGGQKKEGDEDKGGGVVAEAVGGGREEDSAAAAADGEAGLLGWGLLGDAYDRCGEVCAERTDELVDGPNASYITPAALDRWEKRLEDLFEGRPYDMYDAALSDKVSKFPVDIQPFKDMIEGMRLDLWKSRYRTFDELYLYCYYVAGTVGLMTVPVMGISPDSKASTESVYNAALALGIHRERVQRCSGSRFSHLCGCTDRSSTPSKRTTTTTSPSARTWARRRSCLSLPVAYARAAVAAS